MQQSYVYKSNVHKESDLDYLLYFPKDYDKNRNWPLIVCLHGADERGNNIDQLKAAGLPKEIEEGMNLPFIVLSPQCPKTSFWIKESDFVIDLIDFIALSYCVDIKRIYLTGYSMGGNGTWYISMMHPDKFAAIAPICGEGNPNLAKFISHIPIWTFHGAKDKIVKLHETEEMVSSLNKYGAKVSFTIYPVGHHNVWEETYRNIDLYKWFLEHSILSAT
ncbi:MAG TPA: dienelactone hydrolase family protein [Clostridiaceae bacterium]